MLILGAIVGALLFSIGGIESALVGGGIGAVIGGVIGFMRDRAREETLREMKDEVSRLRNRLDVMEDRLARTAFSSASGAEASRPEESAASFAPAAASPIPPVEQSEPSIATAGAIPQTDAASTDEAPVAASVGEPSEGGRRPSLVSGALGKSSRPLPRPARPTGNSTESADGATANDTVVEEGGLGRVLRAVLGDNPVVRIGIVLLFFGVAFLLKYAYDRVHVPIELRLIAVAAAAIVLLVVGFRLRERRPDFGLAAQGGGVGILYLTVFGALKIWSLLPVSAGFVLLVGIAAFSAMLAVLQNAAVLAVVGIAGGFLAPVLASTGDGSHVVLFSYYAVLNVAILGIALFRAWRPLNLLGFVFTFLIGTAWGVTRYRPEHLASTEPFLVAFFLFYVAIPILYAMRKSRDAASAAPVRPDYVDGTLVFGLPVIAFGLQAGLVRHIEYGVAFSALALGIFYVAIASALWSRRAAGMRLLVESFLAMGVAFGTLAIPLALDGRWTAAAWALEGAALLWIGARQQRFLPRIAGALLQVLGALALLSDYRAADGAAPFADAFFLGSLLIGLAGGFSGWWLRRNAATLRAGEAVLAHAFIVWGAAWVAIAFLHDIDEHVAAAHRVGACLLLAAALAIAATALGRRWAWPFVSRLGFGLLVAMVLALLHDIAERRSHPLANLAGFAWPIAIAVFVGLLKRDEKVAGRAAPMLHAALVWVVTVLLSWELGWTVDQSVAGDRVWGMVAWALVPGLALAGLVVSSEKVAWPFRAWREGYLLVAATPIAIYLAGWILLATATSRGDPAPLPYLPILNPLDIAIAAAMLAVVYWLHALETADLARPRSRPALYWGGLGALAFVAANGVLLRSLHHWADVPFALGPMLASKTVQAAFSIFWTLLALVAMVIATRRSIRAPWLVGAALLGVVVVKLLVVDLSGGVERIVSFIAVGLLMLVIGYLAPLPPRRAA